MAGSYDNEAVAIFALIFTFYLYIKVSQSGSCVYNTENDFLRDMYIYYLNG